MEKINAKFGTGGMPPNFKMLGKKNESVAVMKWLNEQGLNAFEIQCGLSGFSMSKETAQLVKQASVISGIAVSIHAPYSIHLASLNPETVESSILQLRKGVQMAEDVGATRIIFHLGGGWGKTDDERIEAIDNIINLLNNEKTNLNLGDVKLYPEIGGKIGNLGSLDEIIKVCKHVDFCYPCIDIAHLHARELGSMTSPENIVKVFDKIEEELGRDVLENKTHFHVYPIDYTNKGEKVHKKYEDLDENGEKFLPLPQHFIKACTIKKIAPYIICEAKDAQDVDALALKSLYLQAAKDSKFSL